tara:strand:- start:40 stop:696 length:657 start_codon:yes stop_codon:yes gene_type:complete
MNVIIKMCGNRSLEDLQIATASGADLLGIIFADAWRRISVEKAAEMLGAFRYTEESTPPIVGVFVDQTVVEVNSIAEKLNLDMVQLHGHENKDYWASIERPLIIAKRIPSTATETEIRTTLEPVFEYAEDKKAMALIEPLVEGQPGGTGASMDFKTAKMITQTYPCILAGGLTPENISGVINDVRPWGVDVSSGVETNKKKDPNKIARFIYEARKANL